MLALDIDRMISFAFVTSFWLRFMYPFGSFLVFIAHYFHLRPLYFLSHIQWKYTGGLFLFTFPFGCANIYKVGCFVVPLEQFVNGGR